MGTPKILDLEAISVSFDGFKVLDKLDFSLDYEELRFLIGPNGAGKTTLLDIITGKTHALSGKATFDGKVNIASHQEHTLARLGIGRKFQTPSIFGSLSVYETLEVAVGFMDPPGRFFQKLKKAQVENIEETLEKISLTRKAKTPTAILSHGEKQWLEIGMLLAQQPKLLLLDEPVAGMTRQERHKTGELLQAISRNRTVLVVEHDMEFVRQFANTVTVLHQGKKLCEGPVLEVQQNPRVIEAYIGRKRETAA